MNYTKLKKYVSVAILFVISLSLNTGCGFWANFKTYFNTYYNANKIFLETEEKIISSQENLFFFEEKKIPTNLSKSLDEVIEKTSSIMQYYNESDYVEDALLMTGKCFYYQQNYSRALRKFIELEAFPESNLALENKLWIAKTHMQLREFDQGLAKLDEVQEIAIEEDETEILTSVFKVRIGYLLHEKSYEVATKEIHLFVESDISDELRAEVWYELGLVNMLIKSFSDAESSFTQVLEYSPTPNIEFNSYFELAKLKKEMGEIDDSYSQFLSLKEKDKYSDSWHKIELELAKIDYERGEYEDAFDQFVEIDLNYPKSESSGIANYFSAEILEMHFQDYDSSLTLYKKAMTSSTNLEYKEKARNRSLLLDKYLNLHKEIQKLAKTYDYITNNESFIQDSLEYAEQARLDSIQKASEPTQNVRSEQRSVQKVENKLLKPIRPTIGVDSVQALNSRYYFELANLFFTEFNYPDSAKNYYEMSLSEQEENPNQAQTYFALGNYYLVKNDTTKADSMFTTVYEKFPFNPIRNEAAKHIGKPIYDFNKDPVEDDYSRAEQLYYDSKYKMAIPELFDIYKKHPNSIYASKALYTIGYILENDLNMPDSAASIYDTLNTKYRTTDYAKSILIKLTGHKQEKTRLAVVRDSIDKANNKLIEDSKVIKSKNVQEADSPKNEVSIIDSLQNDAELIDTIKQNNGVLPKVDTLLNSNEPQKIN